MKNAAFVVFIDLNGLFSIHFKIPAAGVLVSFYEFLFEYPSYCY